MFWHYFFLIQVKNIMKFLYSLLGYFRLQCPKCHSFLGYFRRKDLKKFPIVINCSCSQSVVAEIQ